MRQFIEQTLLVWEFSARTRFLLLVAVLGPTLILVAGAYGVARITLGEPFGVLEPAAREAVFHLLLFGAFSVFVSGMAVAVKEYVRVRKRVFG